jgi:hypothetical protein
MDGSKPEPAPRWRRVLAALVDMALTAAIVWMLRARAGAGAAANERMRWLSVLPPELIREQLGSPGQRMLQVRTVDRRTGRRVALWRSLVLVGARMGGHLLARRAAANLGPPPVARVNVWRTLATPVAMAIVTSGLRRRLAPTREILVRED